MTIFLLLYLFVVAQNNRHPEALAEGSIKQFD